MAKKPEKTTARRRLRLRLTEYARTHRALFQALDNVTWALSGAFVLAFLFWFNSHPYPPAIGLGLLVLLLKLGLIVINPDRKEKKDKDGPYTNP